MKTVAFLALTAAVAVSCVSAEIGSDLFSTIKIVGKLCYFGSHADPIPKQFFDCYDKVTPEDKGRFVTCQMSAFDRELNNKANIDYACTHPLKLPQYASCLKDTFPTSAQMDAAVLIVNQCQAGVVGAY